MITITIKEEIEDRQSMAKLLFHIAKKIAHDGLSYQTDPEWSLEDDGKKLGEE